MTSNSFSTSESRASSLNTPLRSCGAHDLTSRAVTFQVTSRGCDRLLSHFDEVADGEAVRANLPSCGKHTRKTSGRTADDARLNMGPPGDRTRHMPIGRTEDLGWIVDLSWHGTEVVTTVEKQKVSERSGLLLGAASSEPPTPRARI